MNILITGGSGFIGRALIQQLTNNSVDTSEPQITLLTRDKTRAKQLIAATTPPITYLSELSALKDLNDFDVVINLAGEPIADKRWSPAQKERLCQSRWGITKQLVTLIKSSSEPPKLLISGSAVGYYGSQGAKEIDESVIVESDEFTHKLCDKWEKIAQEAQSERTRVCILRTGVVLGQGGALAKMYLPYRLGLGGHLGNGEQFFPWIHINDMVVGILYLVYREDLSGTFNFTAPTPVSNKVFSKSVANALGKPHFLFTPAFALTLIMGESAKLLLDSINAKPQRLLESGFTFYYPHIDMALHDLLPFKSS